MGLTILCEIFRITLSVPHDIVMHLNNVMTKNVMQDKGEQNIRYYMLSVWVRRSCFEKMVPPSRGRKMTVLKEWSLIEV